MADVSRLALGIMRGISSPAKISTCVLLVTDSCNAGCSYCCTRNIGGPGAARGEPLSAREYERIGESLGPLFQLIIGGGEPFLRGDLEEIVAGLCERTKASVVSIPTNGSLREQSLEVLEGLLVRFPRTRFSVMISIDAVGEAHDRLRGLPGCFESATALTRDLLVLGRRLSNLELTINSVLCHETKEELGALRDYLRREFSGEALNHNVQIDQRESEAHPSLPEPCAGPGSGPWARLLDTVYVGGTSALLREQAREGRLLYRCVAGRKIVVVLSDGRLVPCEPWALCPPEGRTDWPSLRNHGLDVSRAILDPVYQRALRKIEAGECSTCSWSCATIASVIFDPVNWLRLSPLALRSVLGLEP